MSIARPFFHRQCLRNNLASASTTADSGPVLYYGMEWYLPPLARANAPWGVAGGGGGRFGVMGRIDQSRNVLSSPSGLLGVERLGD